MPNSKSAKTIFDELVQYPLPKKNGVRDYVFYVPPTDSGYGQAAKTFFDRFYKNHVSKKVATLEELISFLYAEVTSKGVTQIREIVIVVHATALGMNLPLVAVAADPGKKFQALTADSLADFRDPLFNNVQFDSFEQQRKAVIPHLKDDSWVTIRGCNVGRSEKCLYALYSFFGGRANVYAPTRYQVFAFSPIAAGSRAPTLDAAYQHFVKQHFLATDEHTPERKDLIARDLLDPGWFSAPFTLASTPDAGSSAYQALIQGLNGKNLEASLKAAFAASGHPLSRPRKLNQQSPWGIGDSITQGGQTYNVRYEIHEDLDSASGNHTLMARTRIELPSAQESFPIQLFFDPEDDNAFLGKLFPLAGYATHGEDASSLLQQDFEAITALLDKGQLSDGIRARFLAKGKITLSPNPRVVVAQAGRKWTIEDAQRYRIELAKTASGDGYPAQVLMVLEDLDAKALDRRQLEVLAGRGYDPDTPGTELAAYLDQLSRDELVGFIDYLRSPYRKMNAFFIKHAGEAIKRKRGYFDGLDLNQPLFFGPEELDRYERQDLAQASYVFDFNLIWNEVKSSSRFVGTFQDDLYWEESLKTKLGVGHGPDEIEEDSPSMSLEALRRAQSQALEDSFAVADKSLFEPSSADDSIGCDEFGTVLAKLKELKAQGKVPEDIKKALEALKASDGGSYLDKLEEFYGHLDMANTFSSLIFDKEFLIDPQELILEAVAEHIEWLRVPQALLSELGPVLLAWDLMEHVLEEQQNAVEKSRLAGKLVAIRQWIRELVDLARKGPLPEHIDIDLGIGPQAGWKRFIEERRREDPTSDPSIDLKTIIGIYSPDDLEVGFADGEYLMDRVGPEIAEMVKRVLSEVLGDLDVDPCKMKRLKETGLLDLDIVRAQLVARVANAILDKVPRV